MKSNYTTLQRHPSYTNTTGRAPVRLSGLAMLLALLVCLWAAFPQRLQAQTEVAKVQASDKGAGDRFGISVAISGDRAIVGADQEMIVVVIVTIIRHRGDRHHPLALGHPEHGDAHGLARGDADVVDRAADEPPRCAVRER